jgi:hypothetical protein
MSDASIVAKGFSRALIDKLNAPPKPPTTKKSTPTEPPKLLPETIKNTTLQRAPQSTKATDSSAVTPESKVTTPETALPPTTTLPQASIPPIAPLPPSVAQVAQQIGYFNNAQLPTSFGLQGTDPQGIHQNYQNELKQRLERGELLASSGGLPFLTPTQPMV